MSVLTCNTPVLGRVSFEKDSAEGKTAKKVERRRLRALQRKATTVVYLFLLGAVGTSH